MNSDALLPVKLGYNRLLRAFVLVDLKLGKLTHQDLGQMQMYVNYYPTLTKEAPLRQIQAT